MKKHIFIQTKKGKIDYRLAILLICFFVIFFGLIITTFLGEFSIGNITGLVAGNFGDKFNSNNSFDFSAELETPSLELKDEFDKVEFSGTSKGTLSTSDQNFDLSKQGTVFVELYNLDGEINIEGRKITSFKGKADSMNLNGVDINPNSGKLKISFDEDFNYDSFKVNEEIFIDEIDYITTGKITIEGGNKVFDVQNEEVFIDNFYGLLNLDEEGADFEGYTELLRIKGDTVISVENKINQS